MYTVLIIIALLALMLVVTLRFFLQGSAGKSENRFSSLAMSKDTVAGTPMNGTTPNQASSAEPISQSWSLDSSSSGSFAKGGAPQAPGSVPSTGSIRGASPIRSNPQNYPGFPIHPRSQQEFSSLLPLSSLTPPKSIHGQSRYELEREYEHGMRTIYDEKVGAINFIGLHVVMNTPAEVELAFYVCKRQIRRVLQSRRLQRAPTLTDICGIVIGRDATAAWGREFKTYLEEMCIKVGEDTYFVAHYNSQAGRPNPDHLQKKLMRIQMMTSAAINHFQSNIFDTREEAVAFLQRMREIYRI